MKARLIDGKIAELFAGDLSGKYHHDIIAMLVDVPENAQPGWVQTDGVWGPKPPPAIKAIRAASNAMEDNPPADYQDNANWPY